MKMKVKCFILLGIAFFDALLFCSDKKFGPVHLTRFASHVVDDATYFDYPELEQGFAIVGKDFQQFMKAKLVGKDFQDQMVADDGSKRTALHDAITQAQQLIVDGCKDDVQKVLLDVADKKIDENTIYNQKFNYIQRYKDCLPLDACLYDWPVFKEGFDHLDEDEDGIKGFHEYIKMNMKIDQHYHIKEAENQDQAWTSADFMFYDDGEIRLDFIYCMLGAQSGIVDELQEKLAVPIKDTIQNGADLHDVADSKMQYLLKYVDVEFIHKGLQKMFMGNGQELDSSDFIFNVLRTDNIKMFECLLKKKIIIADYQYEKGVTILGHSSQLGSAKIVKKIIELGVDVNQPLSWLPLYGAVANGQYEIVKILLDAGVDVDLCDDYGRLVKDFMQDNKMKNIFTLFAAKKILKEIDHIQTFSEQERVLKLQKGFALLGQDYQKLVNEQLAGRHPDEPQLYESSLESNWTALEYSLLYLELDLVLNLHAYFVSCVARVIEDKSDLDIEMKHNPILQYIDTYHGRSFKIQGSFTADQCLDPSVKQGLSFLDQFDKNIFFEKNNFNFDILNDQGNIRQEFKDIVHEAQQKIVTELKDPFLSELQRCCRNHLSFDDVTDAKVRYLLDHKNVPFIKRALKEFVNTKMNGRRPLSAAIYDENELLIKELLEIGAHPSFLIEGFGETYLSRVVYQLYRASNAYEPYTVNPDVTANKIIHYLFDAGADMDQKDIRGYSAWDKVFTYAYDYPSTLQLFKEERKKEKYQLRDQAYARKNMIAGLALIIGTLNLMDLVGSLKK